MEPPTFSTVFLRQLRYWSLHCTLNALPSLAIALIFLELWKNPKGVAAMLSGIASFILLYAVLTSLRGPLSNPDHVVSRSLKLGTKIRTWISAISVLLVPAGAVFLLPDFWCGMLSVSILNQVFGMLGLEIELPDANPSGTPIGFLPVYLTTMLEGFILSFLLLMISFFAMLFLHRKARRRATLGYPAFEE